MIPPVQAFLAELESAAISANQAEGELRKRMAEEITRLERQRAFAFRRLNLMREVAKAIASAENEESAIACGLAVVRTELGWETDNESRTETLNHFAPVVRAAFEGLCPPETGEATGNVAEALSGFEDWYESAHGKPFWVLFDQYVPELPLVERC